MEKKNNEKIKNEIKYLSMSKINVNNFFDFEEKISLHNHELIK